MKALNFPIPPSVAIALGAVTPVPAQAGALVWSTTTTSYLVWNGTIWASLAASAALPVTGTATLNFGTTPGSSLATVTVSGQTGFTAASHVEAWLQGDNTATHNSIEHLIAPIKIRCGDLITGSFTVYASTELRLTGTFTVHFSWSN